MAILKLVLSPNPLLKQRSQEVAKIDIELKKLMNDMLDTMYNVLGVGLAAVQIGVLTRAVVMDTDFKIENSKDLNETKYNITNKNPKFIINPEIIESSSTIICNDEGCLSFPNASSKVNRPENVKVKYLNIDGKEIIEDMTGLASQCIQHEVDHINGITFVDHLSKLKREMILKKMIKNNK